MPCPAPLLAAANPDVAGSTPASGSADGKDFAIQYEKLKSGGWFSSGTQSWQAVQCETGLPLFQVISKGGSADLQTFSNSDPVSAMIASFTISLKLTPKSFNADCEQCTCY